MIKLFFLYANKCPPYNVDFYMENNTSPYFHYNINKPTCQWQF